MTRILVTALLLGAVFTTLPAQKVTKIPAVYRPVKSEMYKKGWVDFNKNGKKDVYEDPTALLDARIEDLLGQMTLDEKTCQMATLYGYQRVLADDLPTPEWKSKLWKDGIGAIDEHLNGYRGWGVPPSENQYTWPASKHAWALNEVQRFFVEETRLGVPVDFTNEGIRGVENLRATNFPTQLGLGHTWNRELIRKVGLITGREARLLGYTNVYAPILDVGRDQRWGRYEEVYGECPFLVAELGIEMVRGMQHNHQVTATGKHFLAYSNNKGAREGMSREDPQMSIRELEMVHAYPFRRVIQEAGLLGIMCSLNDYNGIPIQGSHYWLTTRLRGEMGFKGYVVSDSDAVEYLFTKYKTAKDRKEAVRQCVEAGLNVRCNFSAPDLFVLPLRDLVNEGGLSEEVVNSRVRDILRVKFLVGLFDTPYQTDLKLADEEVEKKEHKDVALQASRESIVLLKNDNNTLPLDASAIKKIAVCGPNAAEESYALTHYGPLGVEVISALEGIRQKLDNKAEVLYTKGCDLVDAHWPESEIIDYPLTAHEQAEIDKAVAQAKEADVAVVVLGGGTRTSGENKTRSSLELPGRQLDLLKAVQVTGKPVVLVLINSCPLAINWADRFVPAIVEAFYPGSMGGIAIADILFGDYNPGGKLTVTFPKTVGQIPFNFPAKPSSQVDGFGGLGPEGNMTRINGALYSFGHGLSYTTFEYSGLRITPTVITPNQKAQICCTITNTGKREGDEVVQLYLHEQISSVTTYAKNLVGFERVHLAAGESREVCFTIDRKHMELLNEKMDWVVEPGIFNIMVGSSSENIRLKGELPVVSYAGAAVAGAAKADGEITANANQQQVKNVSDADMTTSWTGRQGDFITFPLKEGTSVSSLSIAFGKGNASNATFDIQLSVGGGVFVTVYSGAVKEYGKLLPIRFKGTAASELRVLLGADGLGIAEVKLPEEGTACDALDVYLLIGQSNMAGRGVVKDSTSVPGVYSLNRDRHWIPARHPLHFDKKEAGVGPGLSFAREMRRANPQRNIGLVPCAVGGTSLSKWMPGSYDRATDTHPYDDAVARLKCALQSGKLKGILWHQGEGDYNNDDYQRYEVRFDSLLNNLSRDLDIDIRTLPVVVGELGRFLALKRPVNHYVQINEALHRIADKHPNMRCVSSEGLAHKGDVLHFDAAAAEELGKRYADAYRQLHIYNDIKTIDK